MTTVTDEWLDARRVPDLVDVPLIGVGPGIEAELASLVARLADPAKAASMGAEVPRGLLVTGPPGIGKTNLIRHLAARLDSRPVYEVGAEDVPRGDVVRSLFQRLEERHPGGSVLVMDECDLYLRDRAEVDGTARGVLGAFLRALDGLVSTPPGTGVLVVGATARGAYELDQAILRAGRLSHRLVLDLPDLPARRALLRSWLEPRPLAGPIGYERLARLTDGSTPAQLKAACRDAAGLALAAGRDAIRMKDLLLALERDGRVVARPQLRVPAPDLSLLARIAAHEAAHVVVGARLLGVDRLAGVVIEKGAGQTRFDHGPGGIEAADGRSVRDAIAALLAGTAGEDLVLPRGAGIAARSDVLSATRIAIRYVEAGLAEDAGPIDLGIEAVAASSVSSHAIDVVASILRSERDRAARIVADHPLLVRRIADHIEAEAARRFRARSRPWTVAIELGPLRELLFDAFAVGSPLGLPGPHGVASGDALPATRSTVLESGAVGLA